MTVTTVTLGGAWAWIVTALAWIGLYVCLRWLWRLIRRRAR